MKTMPRVDKFMTAMPHTIGKDQSLKTAIGIMREFHLRHLPVQDGGRLLGVLSDRDIKLAASFQGGAELKVEEVMSPDPYTVRPEASLDQVSAEMAEHKYGCAIVVQGNGKVVGIFTMTDGMRVLGDILKAQYKPALAG